MVPQELIVSAASSETTSTSSLGRAASAPGIHIHDLASNSTVHVYKTSISGPNALSYAPTQHGVGGAIFAVQEGKAIVNVWTWQKDQMHLKLHLPEKLSCFAVSPNGYWAAGGSSTGQVYLWELGSGLLHSSFTAHYRAVTSLTFTSDSHVLLSASLDSSVHVFLVSRLLDEDDSGQAGKPYGTLGDHTLAIRAVAFGQTAGSHGGRCWTASEDGTIKMWSLHPPFDLLATFSFPPSIVPNTITLDATERFLYVGSVQGDIFHIPLFRRRAELGSRAGNMDEQMDVDVEAVGGGGVGTAPVKANGSIISLKTPITALTLSISSTHLLVGTHTGEIQIYSLPSHQHLRTINAHSSPITHLSTLLRPPDLVGAQNQGGAKVDAWPIMEIKPLERMRVGRVVRDVQEVGIVLGSQRRQHHHQQLLDGLRPTVSTSSLVSDSNPESGDKLAELQAENKRLKMNLDKALKLNERMWNGIVDNRLAGVSSTDK